MPGPTNPVDDPHLQNRIIGIPISTKSKVSVRNKANRVIHVKVQDDVNAMVVIDGGGGIDAGMNGFGVYVHQRRDAANSTTQIQSVSPGCVSTFAIQGDCAQVTISDDPNFSDSSFRTPYKEIRLKRGKLKVV